MILASAKVKDLKITNYNLPYRMITCGDVSLSARQLYSTGDPLKICHEAGRRYIF